MVKVRMITTMAGPGGTYEAGSTALFPPSEAATLEAAGAVQILEDLAPAAPQAAALKTAETAVKPAAKRRKRAPRRKTMK